VSYGWGKKKRFLPTVREPEGCRGAESQMALICTVTSRQGRSNFKPGSKAASGGQPRQGHCSAKQSGPGQATRTRTAAQSPCGNGRVYSFSISTALVDARLHVV